MIQLTIDGQSISVPKGTTVYEAAKKLGIKVPIFCYHDRMPPFGACRVCLVEVDKMGKLQTSCTLQATEGMVVKTQSALAAEGRKEILEFLLINHPLDCPICDRGGECPLQDQTLEYGPGESRFYEEKRHFKKALPLGPLLMLDRERCIVCARCTRFGDVVSGDHALEMKERGYKTEVGTPENSPISSKFIGNTIMICPVGALTSRAYRFRARPWDNNSTQTTCTLCPVGCSLNLDARDGEIMRTRSVENPSVNDIWLCDKGWFGYEFASHPDRLSSPLMRKNGQLTPVSWDEALNAIAQHISVEKQNGNRIGALGGNPLTVEENYLFQKLVRQVFKSNHLDHRVGQSIISLDHEGLSAGMEMSFGECRDLAFAVLLGLDVTEEFPILWLQLKEALNRGADVIFQGHYAPEVTTLLTGTITHTPGEELSNLQKLLPKIAELAEKHPSGAFFIGRQYLATPVRKQLLSELLKLQEKYPHLKINVMEGQGNGIGARLAGVHPELASFHQPIPTPGYNAIQLLETAAQTGWGYLHIVGADPASQMPRHLWKRARANLKYLVVQELFLTDTARDADVVLPSYCFLEKSGHFLNIAGQLESIQPGKHLPTGLYSDGQIFEMIANKLHQSLELDPTFMEELLRRANASQNAHLSALLPPRPKELSIRNAPSNPIYPSEALVATFAKALFDQGTRMRHNLHLRHLAKNSNIRIHPNEGQKRNLRDNEDVKLTLDDSTLHGTIVFDENVSLGTIVLPLGFEHLNVSTLSPYLLNGIPLILTKET
ncbi:MAG: NADH-quinone oxidoreductase subunit NuoG [Parachlamydiaceae bacterium]